MSDPLGIIRRITKRKKKTMEDSTPNTHPVLQQLNDKIADLEAKIADGFKLDVERIQTINRIRNEKWEYEERVKNVLAEAFDSHDGDTVAHIADQLDIKLTKTETYEVNVTFTIEIETDLGEDFSPDWDIEFTASHDDLVDYTADVIYSKKTS